MQIHRMPQSESTHSYRVRMATHTNIRGDSDVDIVLRRAPSFIIILMPFQTLKKQSLNAFTLTLRNTRLLILRRTFLVGCWTITVVTLMRPVKRPFASERGVGVERPIYCWSHPIGATPVMSAQPIIVA